MYTLGRVHRLQELPYKLSFFLLVANVRASVHACNLSGISSLLDSWPVVEREREREMQKSDD